MNDRGKPVHLTGGERHLLTALISEKLTALEMAEPVDAPVGPAKEAERVRRLRIRQFRRLKLYLDVPARSFDGSEVQPNGEPT